MNGICISVLDFCKLTVGLGIHFQLILNQSTRPYGWSCTPLSVQNQSTRPIVGSYVIVEKIQHSTKFSINLSKFFPT